MATKLSKVVTYHENGGEYTTHQVTWSLNHVILRSSDTLDTSYLHLH